MDKILKAFDDIANVLPRVDRLKATFGEIEDFQRILALVYSDILEFHRRVYKFFRRRAWHIWFAFAWGHFEHRFQKILGNLAVHCDCLDKQAAAIHFSDMKRMREESELKCKDYEQSRDNRMAREVFGWLSAEEDSQEERLHHFADNRQPGTCNWILNEDHIFSWIENENGDAIIWMTAIPGAGKSFLCSLMIENLELRKDLSTLYYFCKSSPKDSCRSVLRTLAIQLLRQNLNIAPLVHQAYLQKLSGHSVPAMKKMLKDILCTVKSTRIVLDGIDECDLSVQKEVLNSLVELQKHAGDSCKLLVSSRFEPQINQAMPARIHIRIDDKTSEAVELYIQSNVDDLKKDFPGFESVLFQRVEQRLRDKAKGMFLWVRLVTFMLKQHGSESETNFESAIEQLPKGLGEAYGLILNRIRSLDRVRKERAFKILFWVCIAYRPIKMHEVVDGIALRPGQTELNKKTRIQNTERDILDICAPIIEISNGGILDLVHTSAKEYLIDKESGLDEESDPFVNVVQAHFNIAFSCITNLASASTAFVPRLSDGMTEPDLETSVVKGSYGLQSYGHQYWAEHVSAYFEQISSLDDQAMIIVDALDKFSEVRRHNSTGCSESVSKSKLFRGLQKLASYPRVLGIVTDWLLFRSQLEEMGPFESLEAQKDWQLQKDKTFLSLIDYRLREISERLSTMDPSKLPFHIEKTDFLGFISRFGLRCRFHSCIHHFETMQDRNAHEATHVPSYPCFQCDFSARGFRSRKDLDKHIQRYHMSMEDFEIPASLYATDSVLNRTDYSAAGGIGRPTRRSRCWNERGREVLQRGFRHVLAKIKSEITPVHKRDNPRSSISEPENWTIDFAPELSFRPETSSINLDVIQTKIDKQQYHSLAEFKDDIKTVQNYLDLDGSPDNLKRLEQTCDEELAKVLTSYPVFANLIPDTLKGPKSVTNRDLLSDGSIQIGLEAPSESASFESSGLCFSNPRNAYWSSMEEKEFPKLLTQYGRDFVKISDFLKTKTADDVEQHFSQLLSNGREDLSMLADATDVKVQLDSQSTQTIPASPDTSIQAPSTVDRLEDSFRMGSNRFTPPLAALFPSVLHSESLPGRGSDNHLSVGGNLELAPTRSDADQKDKPKRYRRPPRPAFCEHCKDHLHDDHTLMRHIARQHKKTRKVWVCVDASINKNFLARCKNCSNTKSYKSKVNAVKHLREVHFTAMTSTETLLRWMKETEEKNPNFRTGYSAEALTDGQNQLPGLYEIISYEKTKAGLDLIEHPDRLPALQNMSDQSDDSSRSPSAMSTSKFDVLTDGKASPKENELNRSSLDDTLNPNISFDNLLAGSDPSSSQISDRGTYRANRALITPDQVHRLYNLNKFEKAVCQDQVDALDEILSNESEESKRYQEALEDLDSLSRTLRRRLIDYRRQSTYAPIFPISL